VFVELQGIAGDIFVWQRYVDGRQEILSKRRQAKATRLRPFSPTRLEGWMQKQVNQYLKKHPAVEPFSPPVLRRRAKKAA